MKSKKVFLITAIAIWFVSVIIYGMSFIPGWAENPAPAIAFLLPAGALFFFLYLPTLQGRWKIWMILPTVIFLTLGIIFGFNVLTHDWNSWSYAWLLGLAGVGLGLIWFAREYRIHLVHSIGIWLTLGSIVLFLLFGALVGGPFIQAFFLILFILIGVTLYLWATKRLKLTAVDWDGLPTSITVDTQSQTGASALVAMELLSKRELEVLSLIDQGHSNAEIASRMVVAASTVKTHINNIFTKLDVQSRTQAVRKAKDLGLL
jgi:DNA-binding CsgD family transcriptional regulator